MIEWPLDTCQDTLEKLFPKIKKIWAPEDSRQFYQRYLTILTDLNDVDDETAICFPFEPIRQFAIAYGMNHVNYVKKELEANNLDYTILPNLTTPELTDFSFIDQMLDDNLIQIMREKPVVFDYRIDGSTVYEFLKSIEHLCDYLEIPKKNVIYVTSGFSRLVDYNSLEINTAIEPMSFADSITQKESFTDLNVPPINRRFKCVNRIAKVPRLMMFLMLSHKNLLKDNLISYANITYADQNDMSEHSDSMTTHMYRDMIHNYPKYADMLSAEYEKHKDSFPIFFEDFVEMPPSRFIGRTITGYEEIDFEIVTETRDDLLFFSEKTFKPLYSGLPFFLVSAPGSLEYLRQIAGIKSYAPYIDESYDQIEDRADRINHIVQQVDYIVNDMSNSEYKKWVTGLWKIAKENRAIAKSNLGPRCYLG